MKTIREAADRPLRWTRPSMLARQYELTAGPEVVGGLRWESMFGSLPRTRVHAFHGLPFRRGPLEWVFANDLEVVFALDFDATA